MPQPPFPNVPELSRNEIDAMNMVRIGKRIAPEMESRLTELGLIRQVTGGLMLTPEGDFCLHTSGPR
jgi:hypothetical protein